MIDVAVVGARCAGAPLATFLARQGLSVTLFDKARFPSDTASTHIVQPRGAAVLDRLGLLESLRRGGAADTRRVLLAYEDARLEADATTPEARATLSTGATLGVNARRTILDAALVDCAADAGVDVRTRTAVTGVVHDRDGRVSGVRTDTGSVQARLVVGADGRKSSIAQAVGAREYATYAAPRIAVWGYFEGAQDDGGTLRIGRFGRDAYVSTPTDDGLYVAGFVPDAADQKSFLADREGNYSAGIARWPELHALVADAERVGPLRVVADWHGFFRDATGPGWVLVGDAGNFKDPSAAQGITDALRQAERLAEHIGRGLGGDTGNTLGALDAELVDFWRWRDADCTPMHWFAADMGAAGPTRPVTAEVVRDVARTVDTRTRFLQVLNRDIPPGQLLDPLRLGRSALAAVRRRPHRVAAVGVEIVASGRAEVTHRFRSLGVRRRIAQA